MSQQTPLSSAEEHIATGYHWGTWIAVGLILGGLVVPSANILPDIGNPMVVMGMATFVAMPVLRVIVLMNVFRSSGERTFAVFAAWALLMIALGIVIGLML